MEMHGAAIEESRFGAGVDRGWANCLGAMRSGSVNELRSVRTTLVKGHRSGSPAQVEFMIDAGVATFPAWRKIPAPRHPEFVRRIGLAFRADKEVLVALVAMDSGEILEESLGEEQENTPTDNRRYSRRAIGYCVVTLETIGDG